jgi:hypothetical protein
MPSEIDMMREQYERQGELQRMGAEEQRKNYAPDLKERISETQAAVIQQTNPAKAIKAVVASFEGKIINEYGEETKMGEPLMNKYGISRISSYLIPIVNDINRFGNISKKEVRALTQQIIDDITDDIGFNWREYGIKNNSAKDIIVDSCLTLTLITLTRSEEGGEKSWLAKVVIESLSSAPGKQTKKKGESTWEKYFKL